MFNNELKNLKWAAFPMCTIIKIKNKQNKKQFPSPSFYSTTETICDWTRSVFDISQNQSEQTLPPLRLISWAFGGRHSGMDPTGHIITERSLSECIGLFCISQRDWAIGWVGNVNPEAPQQPRAKSGILSNEVAICERAICHEQTFSIPVDLLNREVRWGFDHYMHLNTS